MNASDVVETLTIAHWDGPVPAESQRRAEVGLEAGRVLLFPALAFDPAPDEHALLSPDALDNTRKNISLDPSTGRLGGTALSGAERDRLAAMMSRFAAAATGFLRALLPGYARHLEPARTSFRPAEIDDRPTSPRHDDRRLHVDAFPTRPLHGQRILRLFSNIAPDGAARHWRVGEPFADFASAFIPRLRPALPGSAPLLAALGLTKGRRSAYDEVMLQLHDAAKRDENYQRRAPQVALELPAGTSWLVFTDLVLHAAVRGHTALEQTFHLPLAAMAEPEGAPLRVLERLSGRAPV